MCNSDGHKHIYIRKLVANAFWDKTESKNVVDHIDNDCITNHVDNLRYVTQQENSQNRNSCENSTSKYKGVSYHKQNNKWVAQIQLDGKLIHLGSFSNEKDAGRAYNNRARELSTFFKLNEISDGDE